MAKIPFYSIKSLIGGAGGGGGSTDVKVDGVTVEKLIGKLQANAIIPVTELPTTDIKTKSIYQKQDGDFVKNYVYVNNKWQSVSIIDLTAQQYDALTDEQKTDGTLYIVSDNNNPQITWNYYALSGKPIINGITINGKLTLEDLQLYSRYEVNNLLAQKGNALFVDELPTEMQPLYWYYSKKYQDGTAVVDGKRALYIKDNNGVLQYMGTTADVDLANYYTKEQTNDLFIPKSSIKTTIDDTAIDTDIASAKGVWDLVNAGGLNIEDISNKVTIKSSSIFPVSNYKAFKLGNNLLYLNFQVNGKGRFGTSNYSIGTLEGLKNAGITIPFKYVAGYCNGNTAVCNTYIDLSSNFIYIQCAASVNSPTIYISYLIPINL